MSVGILPYEPQHSASSCGAAALAMVYRSLGVDHDQKRIWDAIASRNAHGHACSRAQALAADALRHGLSALVVQVRDPWLVLERCIRQSIRVIINHAPEPKSSRGHYSALVALDDECVVLHDPTYGPNRTLTRKEFLQLWNPSSGVSEILGQVLIALCD